MKKIVPRLLIVSTQVLLGALFLVFTINGKSEVNFKVHSKEIEILSKFVYDDVLSDDLSLDSNSFETFEEVSDIKEINSASFYSDTLKNNDILDSNINVDNNNDKFFLDREVISSYVGILTGYGPDCYGCGNFNTNKVSTSSGYHIANIVEGVIEPAFTITYNDNEYGEVRIVAADSSIPYYSIVRITISGQDPILAIVLDRGSTVGFDNCRSSSGCLTNFDLLYETESAAISKTYNVNFEILRMGL